MPKYFACVGVYVRTYAKFDFEADSDELAPAAAIAHFKADGGDISFEDTDYNNMAMPTIVSLDNEDTSQAVIEGEEFALCESDARDHHAQEMLVLLQTMARMNYDGEEITILNPSTGAYNKEFVMENDDAVSTLSSLIQHAREIEKKIYLQGVAYAA